MSVIGRKELKNQVLKICFITKVYHVPLEYLIGNDTYVVAENDESYHMYLAKRRD